MNTSRQPRIDAMTLLFEAELLAASRACPNCSTKSLTVYETDSEHIEAGTVRCMALLVCAECNYSYSDLFSFEAFPGLV